MAARLDAQGIEAETAARLCILTPPIGDVFAHIPAHRQMEEPTMSRAHTENLLEVACRLHDRAISWRAQGQYVRATAAARRARALAERAVGPDHPHAQGQTAEAEALYRRALMIKEQLLGPDHPDVAMTLNNLAVLAAASGQSAIAAPLYRRALTIFEACLAPTHPKVLTCRQNYAQLMREIQRCTKSTACATHT
jgi:tetratricopeptide (TPR) repeat protein